MKKRLAATRRKHFYGDGTKKILRPDTMVMGDKMKRTTKVTNECHRIRQPTKRKHSRTALKKARCQEQKS